MIVDAAPLEEEQVDVSGLAQDQALHDERGAAGDREAGALGQAEEQLRGFYLKRCQQTGRHLIRCVSADGVDQRLPRASQWGWQDEVRPQVHQQCSVDVVADVLAGPLAQDDLVYPRALAPVGQVVLPSRL